MIVSVGTDIIEVYRIRETIERTPRFVERVFTENERRYCESRGTAAAQSYAARFAAKEACLKALKSGWSGSISWHDVEVERSENGVPSITLRGRAREIFDELGAGKVHLSMSHTTDHATATVILEQV